MQYFIHCNFFCQEYKFTYFTYLRSVLLCSLTVRAENGNLAGVLNNKKLF